MAAQYVTSEEAMRIACATLINDDIHFLMTVWRHMLFDVSSHYLTIQEKRPVWLSRERLNKL